MKRFTNLIVITLGLFVFGCITEEGPVGPQGPQGIQGPEGPQGPAGESGFVFQFEDINFTAPEYEVFLTYPNDFEGYDSDVALVYFFWGVENVDGEDLIIWRQLPQTVIDQRGTLVYNYDFTKNDVRLFLQATYSLDDLQAMDTDDWVARVVVVPGDFWAASRLQGQVDYNDLKEALDLPDLTVPQEVIERKGL